MPVAATVAEDGVPPTFTAVHNTVTQTTVTLSEIVDGTLAFVDWTINGNAPTAESQEGEGAINDVTVLIFTHPALAGTDATDFVVYLTTGDLTDNSVAAAGTNDLPDNETDEAEDGIPPEVVSITVNNGDLVTTGTIADADTGGAIYEDVDNSMTVTQNDIRLANTFNDGSPVGASDVDVGKALSNFVNEVKFVDSNATPFSYDAGERLVEDVNDPWHITG